MDEYSYEIKRIDKKSRWIYLKSSDIYDADTPAAFGYMVKTICKMTNGKPKDMGGLVYGIEGGGMDLLFQWDPVFGIVAIYPENVTEGAAIAFLKKNLNIRQ